MSFGRWVSPIWALPKLVSVAYVHRNCGCPHLLYISPFAVHHLGIQWVSSICLGLPWQVGVPHLFPIWAWAWWVSPIWHTPFGTCGTVGVPHLGLWQVGVPHLFLVGVPHCPFGPPLVGGCPPFGPPLAGGCPPFGPPIWATCKLVGHSIWAMLRLDGQGRNLCSNVPMPPS